MADSLTILELLSAIHRGQIRIPSFQRGFVWDATRVAHLMDSIYKGYPFGNLLVWRTRTPLQVERQLGPYKLPEHKDGFPIDYLLDGQQRATAIFGVFQSVLKPVLKGDTSWTDIYFDISQKEDEQEAQFYHLEDHQVDSARHFPLKLLFNPPEYAGYLAAHYKSGNEHSVTLANLHAKFSAAKIPIQSIETDNRAAVAIVFERINRLGIKLNTLQLLSAWSWSEEFDLQDQFLELQDVLRGVGFEEIGSDTDLLLRVCVAVIKHETSAEAMVQVRGSEIRSRFSEVRNGLLGAIDFIKHQAKIVCDRILPSKTAPIPLCVFFAGEKEQSVVLKATQRDLLLKWLWSHFFGQRLMYARGSGLKDEIEELLKLRHDEHYSLKGSIGYRVDPEFFDRPFNTMSGYGRAFIALLVNLNPLDFCSGNQVSIDDVIHNCNSREFHHIFPKAYVKGMGVADEPEYPGDPDYHEYFPDPDIMANICILSRGCNNLIGDMPPSQYRSLMPADYVKAEEILDHACCSKLMLNDDYVGFLNERTVLLAEAANKLTGANAPLKFDDIPF